MLWKKRNKNLDAHERWEYNFETNTQKLVRIIALCKMCHASTHYGHSKRTKILIKLINILKNKQF